MRQRKEECGIGRMKEKKEGKRGQKKYENDKGKKKYCRTKESMNGKNEGGKGQRKD